ncbi:MAG TPA: putative lipopolysaccharide heptosyltransferase III [Xanthobacteraceae bacterium]|nr:putative lipopolysaccharide heptosyltransferase III [Xanthobacteraceae bacterium]
MPSSTVDFSTISRALVIHLRHYGDVLLTSPVFSALKKHAPHVEIDALIYDHTTEMLSLHPAITQIHGLGKHKNLPFSARLRAQLDLLSALRARRYDMLISLGLHPSALWLNWLLMPRYHVAPRRRDRYERLWRKSFTHTYKYPANGRRHQIELHLDALRQFGVFPAEEERELVLIPGKEAEAKAQSRMAAAALVPGGFILVHAPSSLAYKQWPAERTARLIEQLAKDGERVVLTGASSKSDLALIGAIRGACRADTIDFSGKLSMKELAALIGKAKLVIAVDSAPVHMAAAMHTPVVVMFGPSDEYIWGPWRVPHRVVGSKLHPCRPCHNAGCGGSQVSDCLVTLPVEPVITAARELLAGRAERGAAE